MSLVVLPRQMLIDPDGTPRVAAELYFYVSGTTTPITVYTTGAYAVAHPNPVPSVSNGFFPSIHVNPSVNATYKMVAKDVGGSTIWTEDNVPAEGSQLRSDLASVVVGSDGSRQVGRIRSETGAVGTTVGAVQDREMYVDDFGANATPGTTDRLAAFNAGVAAATDVNSELHLHDDNALSGTVLIPPGAQQNLSFVGKGKVSTIVRPTAASIASGAVNRNTLFANQSNNGHTNWRYLRWLTATTPGFTGTFIEALEGGGADGSLQAGFSWTWENLWLAPQSTNSGGAHGGFSNLRTIGTVGESIKTAVWVLEGLGNSDHHHTDVVLNASFDAFIDSQALTSGTRGATLSVKGLHAYQHFRGPIINLAYINGFQGYDFTLEADVANVGTTSLGKYHNCRDVILVGGCATTANGTPRVANGLEFSASVGETTSATVISYKVNADVGLRISGAGTIDITIYDSDFTFCQYALQHLSGNTAGRLKLVNCKLSYAEYCILHSAGSATYPIEAYFCEFMNAGYDGTVPGVTTGRNISLSFSGANHKFVGCKIGHDDAKATATHRANLNGTGTVLIRDPDLVGVAPTAFSQGTQAITFDGVDSTMPGMPQFVPNLGGNEVLGVKTGAWALKGGVVRFNGEITVTTLGTGSNTTVGGLPFTVGAGTSGNGIVPQFSGLAVTPVSLGLLCITGTTTFQLKGLTGAAAATATLAALQNGANIRFSGSYVL